MKHFITLLLCIGISISIYAQNGLSYQAIVRNASGIPQANIDVFLRLSIAAEGSSGSLYVEEQTILTDAYGWFNAVVGTGTVISGNLATIDWPSNTKILKVECKPSVTAVYGLLGTNTINPGWLRGSQGAKGNQGDQGLQGLTGMKGDNGGQGPVGPKGDKGDQGTAGANGLKGDNGSIGTKGDKGDAGTGVKIVGSVTSQSALLTPYSGAIGDMVIAQDNGNGHVWDGTRWNNVGQIKGPKGDVGAQGIQGVAGANGLNGVAGSVGPKGDKGDQGIQGMQGIAGPSGTSANAWDITGNSGTSPTTNFIGTTDNIDLKIKRNNTEKLVFTNVGIDIPGNNTLQFGAGIAGKQTDAGKIGYNVFGESDKLSIVGSGSAASGADRKIKLWAEGGTSVRGPLKMEILSNIELGSGVPGKEVNAGKIFYNPDEGLVFFGAGTNTLNRKMRFWAEGDTIFEGNASFNGGIKLSNYTDTPSAGYIRYNTGTNVFEGHNGTSWIPFSGGSSSGSSLWANTFLGANTLHNATTINRVLIAQNPGSVAIVGNQVLSVVAETADKVASFITTNVTDDSKAVEIINQGSAVAFARPIALNIDNVPHAQAGIGIRVRSGGTGIEINSNLVALRANGSTAGPAAIFNGGTGLSANGQGTGTNSTAAEPSQNSIGVYGQYVGNGSFDGTGIVGISLPTGATVPNGRGFGYGGRFTGGNKGIYAEMKENPSSTYLTDLRTYNKLYGAENRPMAGLFKSAGSVGIMAVATDIHLHNPTNDPYSIGVVGRSNAIGTAVKNIGVYGEGEGVGERVGVMGYADSINTSLAVGVRGIAKGDFGMGGEFKAAEGIHVEASRVGLHVQAPFNEFSGASTSPLLTLQRSATTPGEVLNLNNGYIKVSGTNKTAFVQTSTAANITGNACRLVYPGALSTDIVLITHRINGAGYINTPFSVFYDGFTNEWKITRDDIQNMPVNVQFNVLIIKQ